MIKLKKELISKIREIHRNTQKGNQDQIWEVTKASLGKKCFRERIFQAEGKAHANPGEKTQRTESRAVTVAQRSPQY